jgi:DNA repair ATPase RecN
MDKSAVRVPAARKRKDGSHHPHHRILSIEVEGGFLDGTRLEFSDGLNCIIGGRGTGKTTVLEFIRYILGMMPDVNDSRPRAKAIEGHVRGNLGSGTIYLEVETKHGTRYRAERPWGDDVQVLDRDGEPVPVSLDRDLVFKADIYSQNEIEEIATTPRFQLSLIDRFAEEQIRDVETEIARAKRQVQDSAAELRMIEGRIREAEEVVPEIDVVSKRLQELQVADGADAGLINAAHSHKALRGRESAALDDLRHAINDARAAMRRQGEHVAESCSAPLIADFREGPNADLFEEVESLMASFVDTYRAEAKRLENAGQAVLEQLSALSDQLAGDHARQEQQYRDLVAQSDAERQHAVERAGLQKRHLFLTRAQHDLSGLRQKHKAMEARHRKLMGEFSGFRDKRFALRKEVADRLSQALSPMVRVTVRQAGDRSSYETVLKEMLKGCGLQYMRPVMRIVETVSPEELSRLVRKGDSARLAEDAGLGEDQASRILSHLKASDQLSGLETVDLEDEPLIELKDGADYKNSAGLSTGQRCTVILPILLLQSERPLLIDQPEDNLDNAFVYDTIVRNLQEAKGGRQLIFATHNPNIPVLGEADRVFVFSSDGRKGRVTHTGRVDEVKDQVEHLLEGGKEAFVLRMQRYGH